MTRPKVDPDKRQRTAQACDSCKRRKQKCNGIKPCQTCSKRNLTCSYGSPNDGLDTPPSPKRRMREASSDNYISPQKSFATPAATPAQQSAWSPIAEGQTSSSSNGTSESFHNRSTSQSSLGFDNFVKPKSVNYDARQQLISHEVDLYKSRASTVSQVDEEAIVYSNTRMLQDPTGRLLYIGDSATLSFLQIIRMIVDNVAGPSPFTTDPRRYKIVENTIPIPENFRRTRLLPDRQTANILVNSFFTNVSGFVEVFQYKSFMTSLDLCYADPLTVDPHWLCLLHLTFAIGLVMAAPQQGSQEDVVIRKLREGPVDRAEIFYLDAKDLKDPSVGFEDADFWSIQALTLMSVYTLAVSKRNAAYAYHGMAVRSAFALGLHREETYPIYGSAEQLSRRNLWRSLFVLDRFLATALGRPTSIRVSDCSGATLAFGEEGALPPSPFSPPANGDLHSSPSVGLDAAVGSCHVIGVILESVYSSRKISTKVAQEIVDSCKGWHKTLDPSLNHHHQNSASPSQGIAILHINLLYCHSVILLTRPFFLFVMNRAHADFTGDGRKWRKKSLTRLERFADACVSASTHTVALVQAAHERQQLPHRNPFVLYFLFASALVIIANEFSALFPNPTAHHTINNAITIMEYFAQQDTQGRRLLFILTSFRDVALSEQASRSRKPGSGHRPSIFQHGPLRPASKNNELLENVFGINGKNAKSPPSPSSIDPSLNQSFSNPSMTSPARRPSATLRRTSSHPSSSSIYDPPPLRQNSIYAIDHFLDLDGLIHRPNSAPSSDCNDSMGDSAEIDFDLLWQWPGGEGMGIGASSNESMMDHSMLAGMNGNMSDLGLHGMSDNNAPLFGI